MVFAFSMAWLRVSYQHWRHWDQPSYQSCRPWPSHWCYSLAPLGRRLGRGFGVGLWARFGVDCGPIIAFNIGDIGNSINIDFGHDIRCHYHSHDCGDVGQCFWVRLTDKLIRGSECKGGMDEWKNVGARSKYCILTATAAAVQSSMRSQLMVHACDHRDIFPAHSRR